MMQHIAALKSDLNAQLPIEDFKINTGLSNDDASIRQSFEQRNAFENAMDEARQRQESRANNQNQNDVVRDKQYNEARQRDQIERHENRQQEQQDRLRAEQRDKANDDQKARLAEQRDRAEQSTRSKEAESNGETSLENSRSNSGANADSREQENANTSEKHESIEVNQEASESDTKDEFDWVEYVNQVRLLDAKNEVVVDVDGLENALSNQELFAQFIEDQKLGTTQILEGKSQNSEIVDNTTEKLAVDLEQEFVSVHLSEEELKAIFDQEGLNIDADIALDADKLAALDNAVAKILDRFVSTENKDVDTKADANNIESIEKELNSDLLKTLISGNKSEQIDVKNTALEEAQLTDTAEDKSISAVSENVAGEMLKQANVAINENANKAELAVESATDTATDDLKENTQNLITGAAEQLSNNNVNVEDKASLSNQTATENASAISTSDANEVSEEANMLASSPVANSISPDLKADKVVELPKKTNASKGLELLSNLPEEKLTSALENINKRVSEVVTELKAEGKGTEFIAALQAGVKEVKEQLKQGREPGIDLKALVSDALAKTEVSTVQTQTEVKLDRQVTQVANILGVASSLSQATTQAVSATIGLNEVNLQKEVNQAQVENAKQLNQQANNDKAYNILKPDGQTQLAEKVRWMVNNRSLTAEIRLDPPDLGGMQIKVAMSGDAASVNFVVQSQHARDVLDQAAPQLRDMLEEQGISLGESSVQQDSGNNQQELAENENLGTGGANTINSDDNESQNNDLAEQNVLSEQRIVNGRIGGIDHYA
jgi:flagellar hook-length control protein FliK